MQYTTLDRNDLAASVAGRGACGKVRTGFSGAGGVPMGAAARLPGARRPRAWKS